MRRARLHFTGIVFFLGVMIVGCGVTQKALYKTVPEVQKCSNEYYEATIAPTGEVMGGRQGFILTVINKTDKDLELNWNGTYFMKNGQTSGGFMFEGIMYIDRNDPKPPDIIFPGKTFSRVISPNVLVEFDGEWEHKGMGAGEYGVLLSVKVGEKEVREKMLINFVPRWK
jgi:hypothetical protein